MTMLLTLCLALTAMADEEPAATPYRPTVANPAELSAPGYFEIEMGGQWLRNADRSRRASLPYLVKYAFTEDFGVMVGGEAWVVSNESGTTVRGYGDTLLLAKIRLADSKSLGAFGIEAGAKIDTAKTGLGSDENDYLFNTIWSRDFGRTRLDVNLNWTRLGLKVPGETRDQAGWAAGLSHPVSERWSLAGEFSGTARRGADSTAQFLAAAGYSVGKTVVLDAGFAIGLNNTSPDGVAFAGVTVLLR
jgi:hypothetical protein